MPRRAIIIEYDGTDFCGWQLQPSVRTIQGELERAIALAAGHEGRIVLHGAGRTDSGVHARAQVAHFDSDCAHKPDTWRRAINYWLPDDVSVTAVREASQEFHARFSVERKTYVYSVIISGVERPLHRRFRIRCRRRPDVHSMNACARFIVGENDFAAFTASGADTESTVKTIFRSEWIEDGRFLSYLVEGDGFTYNMVRTLVGTMLEVGAGKASCEDFASALESKERIRAGPTAPAKGLMLTAIKYPKIIDPFREPGRKHGS